MPEPDFRQIEYAPGRSLSLYLPPEPAPSSGHPAILLFHGGGWHSGSPAGYHRLCAEFAGRGLACLSAGYRLMPHEALDPAEAVEDAGLAWRFVQARAAELGLDPSRIAAGGGSSGGHLALIATLDALEAGQPPPRALLLYNPVVNLANRPQGRALPRERWQAISPRQRLRPGLPPMLIIQGGADRDVTPETVSDFCSAVRALGGDCRLRLYPGQPHGFFNWGYSRLNYYRTLWDALAFLHRQGLVEDPGLATRLLGRD